ncbi:MAG: hypothetical protein ACRCZ2_13035, partial [Fusobacteriaceae bacterium]
QGLKYEVAKGVGFTKITIPKREEDWLEQTLKGLIVITESSVKAKKELEETITLANEIDLVLEATTKTADEKDVILNESIRMSLMENDNLKETITDSVDKNTELKATIDDSVEKESKLKSTIEESIVKNNMLKATIDDSVSKNMILKATVLDSVDKNTELQETIVSADIKITDINTTVDDRLEEINEVADIRIEEIKVSGGAVNKLDNRSFEFWLGTTAQYEAIVEKSRGIMYNCYAEDGTLVGGYFKEGLMPVKRGLIAWFDFADGKGTENTLKSRVSDDVLTLNNFNYDESSGWTGKGLKFNSTSGTTAKNLTLQANLSNFTVVLNFVDSIVEEANYRGYFGLGSAGDNPFSMQRRFNNIRVTNNLAKDLVPVSQILNKRTEFAISTKDGVSSYFLNGVKLAYTNNIEVSNITTGIIFGQPYLNWTGDHKSYLAYSFKLYDIPLTPEEVKQNYDYEQSIDRTSVQMLPDNSQEISYGIGFANQLSDEQLSTFRLSLDKTKFVAGLRY